MTLCLLSHPHPYTAWWPLSVRHNMAPQNLKRLLKFLPFKFSPGELDSSDLFITMTMISDCDWRCMLHHYSLSFYMTPRSHCIYICIDVDTICRVDRSIDSVDLLLELPIVYYYTVDRREFECPPLCSNPCKALC
jgi:hypothetical protein